MKKRFRNFTLRDLDLVLLGLPVCFAITFFIDSRGYNPTAALFPRLVSVVTLCLLFGAMCQHFFNRYYRAAGTSETEAAELESRKTTGMKWYVNLAIMLVYFLLVYVLGLVVASLLYLLLAPVLMGYKKFKVVAVIAAFWIIIFVYVFYGILKLRMPNGVFDLLL